MYRFVSRSVCSAKTNSSICVYNSLVFPTIFDNVSRGVSVVPVNTLSTSSVGFCEKKDDTSVQDETTKAANNQTKIVQKQEEPVVLRVDDGGSTQHQADASAEQVLSTTSQVKMDSAKTGKESLLDLLGAMKVEVTNKRKLKNLKNKQSFVSVTQQKSAGMESTISMFQKASEEASSQSDTLEPELVAAASAAASTLPNQSQAESELLKQLRQRKALSDTQKKGDINDLGIIIADMKVGKKQNRHNAYPADQIRFDDDGRGYTHERGITSELANVRKRKNLFPTKRLNIFSPAAHEDVVESVGTPTLWDLEFAKELSESINQTPRNLLEEMVQWTKEGKLWQYPINNEVGLEEEANVPFHEHVFLEKHLEKGFPRQGPVRHFMELVVTGLSRNPYLTVEQKKEHIAWFRDYFQQKEEVLMEADV